MKPQYEIQQPVPLLQEPAAAFIIKTYIILEVPLAVRQFQGLAARRRRGHAVPRHGFSTGGP